MPLADDTNLRACRSQALAGVWAMLLQAAIVPGMDARSRRIKNVDRPRCCLDSREGSCLLLGEERLNGKRHTRNHLQAEPGEAIYHRLQLLQAPGAAQILSDLLLQLLLDADG